MLSSSTKQWIVSSSRRLCRHRRAPSSTCPRWSPSENVDGRCENSTTVSSSSSFLKRTSIVSLQYRFQSTVAAAAVVEDNNNSITITQSSSSAIPFRLADIGEGIAEVELLQWFCNEGDEVQQFDRICEVQSDKATVEITSRYDGKITSLEHSVGDMVQVGSPLLFILDESSSEEEQSMSSKSLLHTASTQTEPMAYDDEKLRIPTIASKYHLSSDNNADNKNNAEDGTMMIRPNKKVQTTPAVRKLAKEHNLDLPTIVGTGPKGRVLKGDVLTVLSERGLVEATTTTTAVPTTTPPAPPSSSSTTTTITSIDQVTLPLLQDTTLEIRGYNRLMVQSMTASLQIPHMVYADEINVNQLIANKRHLPFLPFIIKAVSLALLRYPLLNASFHAETNQITLWKDHNIGIAMATPRGLIVPVLRQCQDKSIADIGHELKRLKELAAQGTVPSAQLQGATFTLSNIGAIGGGGTYMSPIVTPPQVAIGAIGQLQRLPRFSTVGEDSNQVEAAYICHISWGGDHRVVDGATLARFHGQWKGYMQDPITLIQEMK